MAEQGANTDYGNYSTWIYLYISSDGAITCRRALSSVIGAVFSIIAITTTIGYTTYSMHLLDNYSTNFLSTNQERTNAIKEQFIISNVKLTNNKFNITAQNTGNIPINITRLYVQNTTATDWFGKYSINVNLPPGSSVSNIGINIPLSALSTVSYNMKLVTGRGNTQQFTINSPNAAPLNIQLLAVPATVATGFKSELLMIVTNNGSSTLVNISPSALPTTTGSATCISGSVSPASYNILSPGSTAIFKWDVTVSGTNGATCTYTLTKPLQNGYTQTVQATITVNVITFTQTNLAQNTGILTLNYTTFRWTQGNSWNTGWSFPGNNPTAFSVNMTNNNSTGDFYVSSYSQFGFQPSVGGANNAQFYIVNATSFSPFSVTKYSCGTPNEYCVKIASGQTVKLYFASSARQDNTVSNLGANNQWFNSMLMYGKFATSRSGPGTPYAQTLPYIAVQTT